MRTSILAIGLSLGVLFNTHTSAQAATTNSLETYIAHKRLVRQVNSRKRLAVSRSTYIKGGKHAQVRKKGKKVKWVRVKIKKHKKAPTQWTLIRKDRYQFATILAIKAQEHGVPVRIAVAVGIQESGLNPNALGDHGKSYGLMQIKCTTAYSIGYGGSCRGLFDPVVNAEWGMRYLKMAIDGGGVWKYNQGIYATIPVKMAARYQVRVHKRAGLIVLASLGILP